jgi:hypothetical protein
LKARNSLKARTVWSPLVSFLVQNPTQDTSSISI